MKSLQLDKPHAIIVIGIQGSGKTFFAQKFSDTFSAPFIEQALFDKTAVDQASSDLLMKTMIEEVVKTKRSVVIELALSTRIERAEYAKILRKCGYVPLFVWVQIDTETAAMRTRKALSVSLSDYKTQMQRFVAPTAVEKPLVISGKHTFATQAKAVLKKLSAPRAQQHVTPVVERPQTPTRGQIIVR